MEERKIYWEPIVSAGAVVVTILGVVVPLFIHLDNRTEATIEAIRQDIREFHSEFRQETKDFHGRLCIIEERRKQI